MDPEVFIKPIGSGQDGFPPASLAAKGGDVRNDLRLIDLLPFPLSVAAANAGLWRTQADDPVQSAMGLSRDKITVRVYKGYIGKGRKEPDPLRAG